MIADTCAPLDPFERIFTRILLIMMAVVVVLATIEVIWVVIKGVLIPPVFLLDIEELLELFGLFLLVLIGLELLRSVNIFIEQWEIHLESVLSVALIAVTRKIIILDPKYQTEGILLGIAALVLALVIGYYVVRRSHPLQSGDTSKDSSDDAALTSRCIRHDMARCIVCILMAIVSVCSAHIIRAFTIPFWRVCSVVTCY